jgi:hypothetical protein
MGDSSLYDGSLRVWQTRVKRTARARSGLDYPPSVARISYVDPKSLTDPELVHYLENARRFGTPRPETQAIRSNVPAVAKAFSRPWESIFRQGKVEHPLKELCRVYVSKTIDCDY